MSSVQDRLAPLVNNARDALADMSTRDRRLLLGLVASGVVIMLTGGGWWMNQSLRDLESRVTSRADSLHMLKVMASDHAVAIGQAEEIKQRLKANEGTDLSSFLEQAAKNASVADRLTQVREKSSSTSGILEEKLYSVALTKLTTDEMAGFLFEVETAGYPLQIRNFKARTRKRKDEKTLDLDMDIAAFRVVNDSPSEEE